MLIAGAAMPALSIADAIIADVTLLSITYYYYLITPLFITLPHYC
jgi:hypothetical protein